MDDPDDPYDDFLTGNIYIMKSLMDVIDSPQAQLGFVALSKCTWASEEYDEMAWKKSDSMVVAMFVQLDEKGYCSRLAVGEIIMKMLGR